MTDAWQAYAGCKHGLIWWECPTCDAEIALSLEQMDDPEPISDPDDVTGW